MTILAKNDVGVIQVSVLTIHSDADFDADFESNLGPSSSKSVEFVNKELSKSSMKTSAETIGESAKIFLVKNFLSTG